MISHVIAEIMTTRIDWDAKKDSNSGILTGNSRCSSTHVILFPNLDGLVLLGRVSPLATAQEV